MPFGQLVIGPAGSGKTTYCNGMQQYLTLTGRKTAVINLDPANDSLPYDCDVDISDLVSLAEVQESLKLGPNGGAKLLHRMNTTLPPHPIAQGTIMLLLSMMQAMDARLISHKLLQDWCIA